MQSKGNYRDCSTSPYKLISAGQSSNFFILDKWTDASSVLPTVWKRWITLLCFQAVWSAAFCSGLSGGGVSTAEERSHAEQSSCRGTAGMWCHLNYWSLLSVSSGCFWALNCRLFSAHRWNWYFESLSFIKNFFINTLNQMAPCVGKGFLVLSSRQWCS